MMRRDKLKHFADKIEDIKLHEIILDKYDSNKWEEVINYISDLMKVQKSKQWYISKQAIKIANRIESELNINVFPIIFKTYAGKWQKFSGSYLWFMYLDNAKMIGCRERASELIKKDNKIAIVKNEFKDYELVID